MATPRKKGKKDALVKEKCEICGDSHSNPKEIARISVEFRDPKFPNWEGKICKSCLTEEDTRPFPYEVQERWNEIAFPDDEEGWE